MRLAVTGTPGTGKTTACAVLETDLAVVSLNEFIETHGLVMGEDPDREAWIADLDAVREALAGRDDVVIESHLAHHLDADRVVVLRCQPDVLIDRLRAGGASEEKARENAESEALDLILWEAVDRHGPDQVYEIDTTHRNPGEVTARIQAVVEGTMDPAVGIVSFLEDE